MPALDKESEDEFELLQFRGRAKRSESLGAARAPSSDSLDEEPTRSSDVDIMALLGMSKPSIWAGGDDVTNPTREEFDAKIAASEARAETRFVELNGKLDRLIDSVAAMRAEQASTRDEVRSDYKATRNTVIATVLGSAIALAALLVSIVTYGDAIFSRGMQVRDIVNAISAEMEAKRAPQTTTPSENK